MTISYLSICSGIEAATVAWEPLGWRAVGFAEIDKFPSAVLAHHYGSNMPGEILADNTVPRAPDDARPRAAGSGIPNYGDFTALPLDKIGPVYVLVGGTPCQAFSFAGKRQSLADARGNLTLAFAVLAHDLADRNGLRNAVWENVPGVLSAEDNAFGCFLSALVGADAPLRSPLERGRWPDAGLVAGPRARAAWRVLDAQHFGLAQRRARVFVVVDFGNGADPAEVLFEPKGGAGDFAAGGEAREGPAADAGAGAAFGGGAGHCADLAPTLNAAFGSKLGLENQHIDGGAGLFIVEPVFAIQERAVSENPVAGPQGKGWQPDIAYTLEARHHVQAVAHTLRAEGFDASEDGTGRGIPLVPVLFSIMPQNSGKDYKARAVNVAQPLMAGGPTGGNQGGDYVVEPIAFSVKDFGGDASEGLAPTLRAGGHSGSHANAGVMPAVAFDLRGREGGAQFEGPHDTANIRAASGGSSRSYVCSGPRWAVRRLTPRECERLQGFPDDYTLVPYGRPGKAKPAADGPRYKALGNSKAVPVVRWIGHRLDAALRRRGAA